MKLLSHPRIRLRQNTAYKERGVTYAFLRLELGFSRQIAGLKDVAQILVNYTVVCQWYGEKSLSQAAN